MASNNRVTLRRRKSYNTKSNRIKIVKTPGGKLVAQYRRKPAGGVRSNCPLGTKLTGLKKLRNSQYKNISKTQRRICRPYGGVLTPGQTKENILRAFLLEEVKIVKERISREENERKNAKKGGKKRGKRSN